MKMAGMIITFCCWKNWSEVTFENENPNIGQII